MDNINFKLTGLTCPACVKLASRRLEKIPGVIDVKIDLESGKTEVRSNGTLDLEILETSLAGTDYSIAKL
ncbi:MAG TPA: heavy metal-associated domain-containing protein [Candidatus Saccharimonadales bacterium]|nr:heavy metal-associated domain-containing protein [Candidatus Saccharimonadales bacterium]